MRKPLLGCLGVAVLVLLALLIGGCASYNRLVNLSQSVDAQWAQVQNVYQRRADLVPNLVSTVSGAADFERQTLNEVIQARQQVNNVNIDMNQAPDDAAALQRFQQAQENLSSALSRLLVVVERYPELKANANFLNLQTQLEGTENRIAVERRRFNEDARDYNSAIRRVPTVFFASMLGFNTKPYFAAQPGAETPPEVKFEFTPAPATR